MGREEDLAAMGLTEIFAIYTETGALVQRLDGSAQMYGDLIFVPVEEFHTGKRFEPCMGLLTVVQNEMEVIARAVSHV
jgi:hypothetical protein